MHARDRLSSMSLIADGPLIQVNGRVGVGLIADRRVTVGGTIRQDMQPTLFCVDLEGPEKPSISLTHWEAG